MTALTPLESVHCRLGATFTDFAGWSMPLRYDSEVAEHHAVRSRAGLFDLSHMGEIDVTGPEAARALDYALVGHASAIDVGRARYSMMCNEDGGVVDDLVVYRLEEDHYFVVANASNASIVVAELEKRTGEFDANVMDASPSWALVAIQGPSAVSILAQVIDESVHDLKYYAISMAALADVPVRLARTGYTGEDGFEIYCAPMSAEAVWTTLLRAGEPDGLRPAGLACRDTLRLEAGMPLHGHELGPTISPFDAGLGRVVKFDKDGPFVGRDALIGHRDHGPSSVLVGLVSNGRRAPRSGYELLDDHARPIGRVTSGAPSPTLRHPIAMGFVPPSYADPGTRLLVDVRGRHEDVEVVPLPFYRRPS